MTGYRILAADDDPAILPYASGPPAARTHGGT